MVRCFQCNRSIRAHACSPPLLTYLVLVDKPVTTSVAEAKELATIARAKGLVLYAFQNRRWDSDFLALSRLISLPKTSPQSLGTILEFES